MGYNIEKELLKIEALKKKNSRKTGWLEGKDIKISTGYNALDVCSDAIKPGLVTIICGRICMGKTKFATNIAQNVHEKNKVAFFSTSDSTTDTEVYFLSMYSGIEINKLKKWNLTDDEWGKFKAATKRFNENPLAIYHLPTLWGIKRTLKELQSNKETTLDLLIIDGLNNLSKDMYEVDMTPKERLIEIKELAEEYQIPIIVTLNLAKMAYDRQDFHPHLKDIKDTRLWEGSWDTAMLLHRDDYYDPKVKSNAMEITVVKAFSDFELTTIVGWDKFSWKMKDVLSEEMPNAKKYTIEDLLMENIIDFDEEEAEREEELSEEDIEAYELSIEMKDHLIREEYNLAMECANQLSIIHYTLYINDIMDCYKKCAREGNVEALLSCESRLKSQGKVVAEEFYYLSELVKKGYIKAFDRIGDCYYYGIGCAVDLEMAKKMYINGILFTDNQRCKNMLEQIAKDAEKPGVYSNLLTTDYWKANKDRTTIANKIFDGEVKEYNTQAAYFIYKDIYTQVGYFYEDEETKYGSKPLYNLALCLKDGIGTTKDAYVAYRLFDEALEAYMVNLPEDEEMNEKWQDELVYQMELIEKEYASDLDDYEVEGHYCDWQARKEYFIP